jgi:hypothetical protein
MHRKIAAAVTLSLLLIAGIAGPTQAAVSATEPETDAGASATETCFGGEGAKVCHMEQCTFAYVLGYYTPCLPVD